MTVSEYIKLQARLLEWEAPKWFSNKLEGYEKGDYMWVTNHMVIVRIPLVYYTLNMPLLDGIERFTKLPDEAVKGWLTETRFKDKEEGMLVRAEAIGTEAWVKEKYIKLFGKADKYDVWIIQKVIWLTEPDTKEVIGVIAGVRGINERLEELRKRNKKGDKNGRN